MQIVINLEAQIIRDERYKALAEELADYPFRPTEYAILRKEILGQPFAWEYEVAPQRPPAQHLRHCEACKRKRDVKIFRKKQSIIIVDWRSGVWIASGPKNAGRGVTRYAGRAA